MQTPPRGDFIANILFYTPFGLFVGPTVGVTVFLAVPIATASGALLSTSMKQERCGGRGAICEAVGRPAMRFVAIKTDQQHALAGIHRVRDLLIKQRTMLKNQLRGLMAGNGYLRRLLVNGATSLIKCQHVRRDPWVAKLLAAKPRKVVAVALATSWRASVER